MAELELVGLHPDGEHVVLAGPDGHRHRLPIDDALRAAVRNDRPRLEQVRTSSAVRPREIQTRLRGGESSADIARAAGVPVEHIRRYEGPVTAERTWVAQQARLIPLGRESGAPRLGELVVDRLARRGVDPDDLEWTATRRPGETWELVLEFRAGERDRQARWSVDIPTGALKALDDESRWLSETDLGTTEARRHLSSVQSRVYDVEVDALTDGASTAESDRRWPAPRARVPEKRAETAPEPPHEAAAPGDDALPPASGTAAAGEKPAAPASGSLSEADARTAELLEGLRASRGVRKEIARIDEEDDGDWEEPAAHDANAASAAHKPGSPSASVRQLRSVPASHPAETHDVTDPGEPGLPPEPTEAAAGEARALEGDDDAGGTPGPGPVAREPAAATENAGEKVSQRATERASRPVLPEPGEPVRKAKSRSRRTSVPSWDEIVFGSKPE